MDIKKLNNDFINLMKKLPNIDIELFMDSISTDMPCKALRINTIKIGKEKFAEIFKYDTVQSPYSEDALILTDMAVAYGNHPYHHAGLYYLQEPSAMITAEAIKPFLGDKVLDMCAAPGGKATAVAAMMQDKGVLVANEIVYGRAKVLRSNIERMGIRNCMVTSNTPDELERIMSGYFDTVIVDAPCSGEGMLRKEPAVLDNWSLSNVKSCAQRDLEILKSADKCLKKGGYMAYSTCTLNTIENEEVLDRFLSEHSYEIVKPDEKLRKECKSGFLGYNNALRVFPHQNYGEGHFVCILRKTGETEEIPLKISSPFSSAKEYKNLFENLFSNISTGEIFGDLATFKDNIYIINDRFPFVKGLNIVNCGVTAAIIEKNRLTPHHNMITSLKSGEVNNKINYAYDSKEIERYLKGEVIVGDYLFEGYGAITVDNYPLGIVKSVGNTLKNHYPKGLRIK